jgi:hypothetical protein
MENKVSPVAFRLKIDGHLPLSRCAMTILCVHPYQGEC